MGFTTRWLAKNTPADLAEKVLAAQKAHRRRVEREIRRAIYNSGNYSINDHLVDNVQLDVKAFLNADSAPIPNAPQDGASFNAATHTHYLGNTGTPGTLGVADVNALIDTVIEHSLGADIKIGINRVNEAEWRGLSGFVPYVDSRMEIFRASTETSPGSGVVSDVPGVRLDQSITVNRAIGFFGAAEILVKSWVPEDYPTCWDAGWSNPLAFRQDEVEQFQGLQLVAENDQHPLRAQFMEALFGVGVWERTAMAVLDVANATYTDPTIN